MTRFASVSNAQIVDTLGALDAQIKALETEKKALRAEIEARGLDAETVVGNAFAIKFSLRETSTLDKKAVEATLGAQWIADHSKTSVSVVMTITALNTAAASKAA